jgi:hypothetical protein
VIRRFWWLAALALVAAIVIVLAPLASSDPDGLERVAEDIGFAASGEAAPFELLPDYSVPFVDDGPASLILAGLIGVGLLLVIAWSLGRLLARRAPTTD